MKMSLNPTSPLYYVVKSEGEDDVPECSICLTDEKDSVFAPCGHFMTCCACSKLFTKCPMCRGHIAMVYKRTEIGGE